MDNMLMIGVTRQLNLRRDIDIVANNIANANTAGFKVEHLLHEAEPARGASHEFGPTELQFSNYWGVARDFRPGQLELTDRELDVAIQSEGFFAIETPQGDQHYTRDGRFKLGPDGVLTTTDGRPVLDGQTLSPIFIDETAGPISITEDGTINQGQAAIGRIGVFTFDDLSLLEKGGDGRFIAQGIDPIPVENAELAQGFVEASNVQPVMELTRMMEMMRVYSSVSRFLKNSEDLLGRSIERLGKVA